RQSLYTELDVQNHLPKAMAAFNRLSAINSTTMLNPVIAHLGANNIAELLNKSDLIIDATDNLRVRYLINEYAVRQQKPWIHGAVASTYGRVMTFIPNITPCFQCVYPNIPELDTVDTCDTVGVLGSIVSVVGSYQVTEALKWLTGNEQFISTAMVEINVWTQQMMKLDLANATHKNCPVCMQKQFNLLDRIQMEHEDEYTVLCGRQ